MALSHPPLVILLLMILLTAVKSEFIGQTCDWKNNYTADSTYDVNLKNLTSKLLSSIVPSGFFNYTVGNDSDQVFGLALCRGDQDAQSCQSCITTTLTEATKGCPYSKGQILWYEQCFLHYSPTNFFSRVGDVAVHYCSGVDATQPQQYNYRLNILMDKLITKAVNSSNQMFAADFVKTGFTQSDSNKLFGLVQCTRDLSKDDCYTCLKNFVKQIPVRCYNRYGARYVGTSCMIRYEYYLFFNFTDGTNNNSTGSTKVVLIVGILAIACIILPGVGACLLWAKKMRNAPHPRVRDVNEDGSIGTAHDSPFESKKYHQIRN